MQDRPTAAELLEAVREFLEGEILPLINDPRLRFRTRVSMNALTILMREQALEEQAMRAEYARLTVLLDEEAAPSDTLEGLRKQLTALNQELAKRIRARNVPGGQWRTLRERLVTS